MPPFLDGAPDGERSLHYFAFNRNKRAVTLDLTSGAGREELLRLAAGADFLFESASPEALVALGLGFEDLCRVNPRMVYVAITPYGQDGPYAKFAATDLTLSAMGGQMALQGDAGRPPVRITVPQVWLHASSEAAVASLVAHALMLRTGEAQFVDVSGQASVVWTMMQGMVAHAIQGWDFNRAGGVLQLATISLPLVYECADGYIVAAPNGATLQKMVPWFVEDGTAPGEWVGGEEWATYDIRLLQGQRLVYSLDEVLDATRRYLKGRAKDELMDRGLREGVTIAPVNTVADLSRFRQLDERGYWLAAPLPDGRNVRVPGLFARTVESPMTVRRWAPRLGEHNEEVLGAAAARRAPAPVKPSGSGMNGRGLPFAGLKVADFTWLMAGPVATKYLADHGASVVRIETANPPDRIRAAGPYKDGVPGANRSQFFGDFNTSKLSLSLDLKNPEGLAVARRLIGWADICVENFAAGTADGLGIGYEAAKEINPSIIFASSCMMGQTGPAAGFAGYGYHAAAIAGFYEITGWPDAAPAGPWSAYTDAVAPRFFAATIMAALDRRCRTGHGERIDISQVEAALTFLWPQLIDYESAGHVIARAGNRSETAAPHAAYPCAGEDQWCAIAVESDEQWRALRRAVADPEWARDERFATAGGRVAAQDEIDARLSEWTRERPPYETMRILQEAGVPAGVAQRSSDLLEDPQLAHRRFHRFMDAVGNRSQMVTTAGTTSYGYDALYRLTQVIYPGPSTTNYTYDANGNRQTMQVGSTTTTYTYDAADEMNTVGAVAYLYDANGNQTNRGANTFTYDHENRLTKSVIGSATSTSIYNGDGLRVSHKVGSKTTSYTWDVARGMPVLLQDGTNTYVYGLDLISSTKGTTQTYFLNDGLGSTANLTSSTGSTTVTYTYDAFGAIKSQTGSSTNYWLFTGEQRDSDTSLYFLRARYYDPATGRFLAQDPLHGSLGNPQTQNRYTYSVNNPVRFVDPWGLECSESPFDWGDCVQDAIGGGVDVVKSGIGCFTEYNCSKQLAQNLDWWAAQLQNAAAVTSTAIAAAGCVSAGAMSGGTMTWAGCLLGKCVGELFTVPLEVASNVASVAGTVVGCTATVFHSKEGGGFTAVNLANCGISAVVTYVGIVDPEDVTNALLADFQYRCRDRGECW